MVILLTCTIPPLSYSCVIGFQPLIIKCLSFKPAWQSQLRHVILLQCRDYEEHQQRHLILKLSFLWTWRCLINERRMLEMSDLGLQWQSVRTWYQLYSMFLLCINQNRKEHEKPRAQKSPSVKILWNMSWLFCKRAPCPGLYCILRYRPVVIPSF